MVTLQELIGQKKYDLLYTHYDINGLLIQDMEDVFYCNDNEIPQDRIPNLEALLTPIDDINSSLVPIEAAKLLAAWGFEKAIDYFEYCIDNRIDRLGNIEPHRLHTAYDTIYEKIAESLFQYHVRYTERDYIISNSFYGELGERARRRISIPLIKIIELSRELTIDLCGIIGKLSTRDWPEFLPVLKECYLDFSQRPEGDLSRKWNLPILRNFYYEQEK